MFENFDWWFGMMPEDVKRWAIGLLIALYGGHVAARSAMWWHWKPEKKEDRLPWWIIFCFRHIGLQHQPEPQNSVSPVSSTLMGWTERFFFALVTALSQIGFAAGSMMMWLAIKTALNWKRRLATEGPDLEGQIRRAQGSAYGSLVSFLLAALGGLICSGEICLWLCD